jgi:benzoate-CoA ligase
MAVEIPERFNITTLLLDVHLDAGRGDRPAYHTAGGITSYRELAGLAARVGHTLRDLGVEMEQRVIILLPDSVEFVASFLGAVRIGAVPVPVSTLASTPDYAYVFRDARPKALIAAAECLPPLRPFWHELVCPPATLVVGEPGDFHSFAAEVVRRSDKLPVPQTHRDDQCYWLYSSGTTGKPKGVVHLQHDMAYCIPSYAEEVLRLSPEDRGLSVARLFFSYGLVNSLFNPLMTGSSAVLFPERPEPARVLDLIARYRPTLFYSVPTSYAALLRQLEAAPRDLPGVRLCLSAGETLPAPIFERWRERTGLEILDFIGSTEAGYAYLSNWPGQVRPGSTGRLLPWWGARLVGDGGDAVPTGEVGELWIKGDSVAAGYWNQHERTKAAFVGEWFRTGDKFTCDADGFYTYIGRSDDLLRVGAMWVAPVEVEAALLAHPGVAEAAVVGQNDEHGLQKPKAFVVLRDGSGGGQALVQELQQFVKDRLTGFKYPRWIEFVPDLPKTATGKVQRFKLRAS